MGVILEFKTVSRDQACLSVKASESGDPVRVSGYLSTYGDEPDSYGDRILATAFDDTTLAWKSSPHPLPLLWQHDSDQPIGHWLPEAMRSDSNGLFVEGILAPGNSKANDVAALLKIGSISGLSIGFRTKKAKAGPKGTRILEVIDLFEGSVVVNPANRHARVTGVKSDGLTLRQFEAHLRELGLSRREAEAVARDGFKAMPGRDDRDEGQSQDGSAEIHRFLQSLRDVGRELRRT